MIRVLYSKHTQPLTQAVLDHYATTIFFDNHLKVNHYLRWQDVQAHLMGRLLLMKGLQTLGISEHDLPPLQYSDFQRPYFDLDVDFSIAHSGDYVLCAVSDSMTIGVDIERIRPIALAEMQLSFSEKEWEEITKSQNPNRQLFDHWTRKEAVAKADGRGMSVAHEIELLDAQARVENVTWYLRKLVIDEGYCAYVATSEVTETKLTLVDF